MSHACEAAPVPETHAAPAAELQPSAPPGDGDWDVINEATRGQFIPLGPEGVLKVRLTWNSAAAARPDLDISALCFGRDGTLQEAVYYNQPVGLKRAVLLNSGDQQAGAVGEEIAVRLLSVLPNTSHIVFVVSSANDVPLALVEGTVVSATLTNVPPGHPFSCDHITWQQPRSPSLPGRMPSHSSAIPLYLVREAGGGQHWGLRVLDEMASGRTFVDALPRIRELCQLPATGKVRFQAPVMLTKNERVLIDTQTSVDGMALRVGCGWDPAAAGTKPSDVDLSAFCFGGADGRALEDLVYWGKLAAFDDAVVHTGDNRTGAGEGDDETVVVRLHKLPLRVQAIVFFVSNYRAAGAGEKDGAEGQADLRSVRNAHFVVTRASDAAELVRFAALGEGLPADGSNVHGMLMCSFARLRGGDGVVSDRYWGITCHCAGVHGSGVHDPLVLDAAAAAAAESAGKGVETFHQVNLRGALRHLPRSPEETKAEPPKTTASSIATRRAPPAWWKDPLVRAAIQGAAKKVLAFLVVVLLAYWYFEVGGRKPSPYQKRFR